MLNGFSTKSKVVSIGDRTCKGSMHFIAKITLRFSAFLLKWNSIFVGIENNQMVYNWGGIASHKAAVLNQKVRRRKYVLCC